MKVLALTVVVALLGVVPATAQEGDAPNVTVVSKSWWSNAVSTQVVGEIRNDGTRTVLIQLITATPVNALGQPIGFSSNTSTRTWALWLKPGEKAPFDVVFVPPVAPADFSIEVSSFNTASIANRFFQLSGVINEPGGRVTGSVTNLNTASASNVKVMATYYDTAGKVVDVAQGIAVKADTTTTLNAGETAAFEVTRFPGAPAFNDNPVLLVESSTPAAPPPVGAPGSSGVGLFDPASGQWHLRYPETPSMPVSFYYGTPGDLPLLGDWDCDDVDTVGAYRQSNGFVYLRNSNTTGVGEIQFFLGNPGDIPLVGDFDGDGCDTVSVYRPSEGRVFIANVLGANNGFFTAQRDFYFGVPGDRPFAGDFDGDGQTTVGLYRESTGFVYFRNLLSTGPGEFQFFYGDPSDRIVAGDWDANGTETVGIFRPSNARFYLSNENKQKAADIEFPFGQGTWLPTAGKLGGVPS